jgi:hypothetical protein
VYRSLQAPDGPTRSLLCGECEDRFSEYESTFARVVFHPLIANHTLVAKYDKWLLQFAASVCWRVLAEHQTALAEVHRDAKLASCRETWRQFLLGKRPDVGEHPIHLLCANRVAGEDPIEMAVLGAEGKSFAYARLGPVILFGLIANPDGEQWRGTRIHLEGKIKPREVSVPEHYCAYIQNSSGAKA